MSPGSEPPTSKRPKHPSDQTQHSNTSTQHDGGETHSGHSDIHIGFEATHLVDGDKIQTTPARRADQPPTHGVKGLHNDASKEGTKDRERAATDASARF
jgi:hypothetical protein